MGLIVGDLDDLLVTGPFDQALRAAIARSGLSLERIRTRIARKGPQVSLATLSHWQSGRSQPERPESLVALRVLEEVVEVPPKALSALIGDPRPRGRLRSRPGTALPMTEIWPRGDDLSAVSREYGPEDDHLTRLSHHDLVEIGPDRSERVMRVRMVLRAEKDGIERVMITYRPDPQNARPPVIKAGRHCAIERTVDDPQGYVVTALAFDRTLERCDSIMIEYEVHNLPPQRPTTSFERKLRLPVREYLLEVAFHPDAPPARVHHAMRTRNDDAPERVKGLRLDPAGSVHVLKTDAQPGCYGVHWQWS